MNPACIIIFMALNSDLMNDPLYASFFGFSEEMKELRSGRMNSSINLAVV
jgi:hypothetical protein